MTPNGAAYVGRRGLCRLPPFLALSTYILENAQAAKPVTSKAYSGAAAHELVRFRGQSLCYQRIFTYSSVLNHVWLMSGQYRVWLKPDIQTLYRVANRLMEGSALPSARSTDCAWQYLL